MASMPVATRLIPLGIGGVLNFIRHNVGDSGVRGRFQVAH